jgi:hypothetical protein
MDWSIADSSRFTSPRLLKALQILFGLNALLWLVSFLSFQSKFHQVGLEDAVSSLVITGLMGGSAIAMLLAGLCLSRRCKLYLYFTAGVVMTNIMLAGIDHIGIINPVTLLVDILILALLPTLYSSDIPVY